MFVEPTESDAYVLDQMTVMNLSDQEALDDFLNSTDDDIIAGSSLISGNHHSVTLQLMCHKITFVVNQGCINEKLILNNYDSIE